MARIQDILDIERQRTEPETWNVIHLFKEGGFYRAYEWSAWLIVVIAYNDEVRKQSQDRKPLSITHKKVRNSEDSFLFVGFPLKSLDKFIPNQTNFEAVTDTQIDVTIQLPDEICELGYDHLADTFGKWKQEQPIQEPKSKPEDHPSDHNQQKAPRTITGIMNQILAYPLEQRTPMENTIFISTLKQQLSELL